MDSWTDAQLALMKTGGNGKCAAYLKQHGVDSNTPIKQKYESPVAQLYKEVLKARAEGRPEPTKLPEPAPPRNSGMMNGAIGKPGEDPNGMERLMGETESQYVARQTRLRNDARARMAAKFGNGGGMGGVGSSTGGRMLGIGSDSSYDPNRGYGGDLGVDSLVSGLGTAFSSLGNVARTASHTASSMIQDPDTQRYLSSFTGSAKNTGSSLWNSLSSSVTAVAATVAQPDSGDGLADLQREWHANRSATGSKYSGFGSDTATAGSSFGGTFSLGESNISSTASSSTLEEAPGLPGEDRNGIERLSGESDEQYIMRQTRLREEAKARMAAKFGGGGLSSVSSTSYGGGGGGVSSTPASRIPSAPSSNNSAMSAPTTKPYNTPPGATISSGLAPIKSLNATKVKLNSTDDFFASFGT